MAAETPQPAMTSPQHWMHAEHREKTGCDEETEGSFGCAVTDNVELPR
jgi:hypothetical protein